MEGEDGERFGDVGLKSAGTLGDGRVVAGDRGVAPPVGLGSIVHTVNTPDVVGDLGPHRDLGHTPY